MIARFHQLSRVVRDRRYEIILISLITFFVIVDLITNSTTIKLVVDGKEKTVTTRAKTVAAVLSENGVGVKAFDKVTPRLSSTIKEGTIVNVKHAVPVNLDINKKKMALLSTAETVGEALKDFDLNIKPADKVEPAKGTKITAGMTIKVIPVTTKCEVIKEPVPFQVVKKKDASLEYGKHKMVSKGKPGLLMRVIETTYEGDQPVRSKVKLQSVISPPQAQIVAVGTKRKVARLFRSPVYVSRGDDRNLEGEVITMQATAYAPNYGPGVGSRCANGMKAQKGVVAVDPRVIPLGTRLYIEGYGEAIAADTGGAIKGNRIDLCYNTPSECFKFGRRTVKVHILGK